jgi:hypothetical protein
LRTLTDFAADVFQVEQAITDPVVLSSIDANVEVTGAKMTFEQCLFSRGYH